MCSESPFAKRLKEMRKSVGISQKQLGIEAGIDEFSSSARMNQYEKGTHAPDFGMVSRIAEVLGVEAAYFYTLDDSLAELILGFSALDQEQKSVLLALNQKLKP